MVSNSVSFDPCIPCNYPITTKTSSQYLLLPPTYKHWYSSVPIVLPFPECLINGTISHVAFGFFDLVKYIRFINIAVGINSLILLNSSSYYGCIIHIFLYWRTFGLFSVFSTIFLRLFATWGLQEQGAEPEVGFWSDSHDRSSPTHLPSSCDHPHIPPVAQGLIIKQTSDEEWYVPRACLQNKMISSVGDYKYK